MSSRASRLPLLLLVILIVSAGRPTPAASPQPAQPAAAHASLLPFAVTERTLPNGLKVIVVPTGFPNIVSVQIPVQTGSRNEVEPGKSGFAHFFEHMMFRGTRGVSRRTVYQRDPHARPARARTPTPPTTTRTTTRRSPRRTCRTILEIEADRFQNLSYTEEAFKTEARAVLGEYNKNSAEPAQQAGRGPARARLHRRTPYKHTTMGFLRDIEDMPNQYRVLEGSSSTAGTGPSTRRSSSPAT